MYVQLVHPPTYHLRWKKKKKKKMDDPTGSLTVTASFYIRKKKKKVSLLFSMRSFISPALTVNTQ
jgi:hypothetical protein